MRIKHNKLPNSQSPIPNSGPSNLGGPARVIGITVLIFVLSQVIAAALVGLFLSLLHPHASIKFDNSVGGQFFYILIAEGLAALLSIWIVRRRGLGLAIIGLGRRPRWKDLVYAGTGFLAFYAVLIIASVIVSALWPEVNDQKQQLGFNELNTSAAHAIAFISLVLIPPLGEEVLVRGYLFGGLRKVWRFWPAVLVTSSLFGLAHLEFGSGGPLVWAAALDTFLLSVVLCFLREKSGALYAGILVHVLNNLIAFGVHFR